MQYKLIASAHACVCSQPSHMQAALLHGELSPANGQKSSENALGDLASMFVLDGLGLHDGGGDQAEDELGPGACDGENRDGLGAIEPQDICHDDGLGDKVCDI